MSGIAVIWNRSGRPVEMGQLVQMTQLMEHRGPDGARHWVQGPIAMGHRTLNTTPESSLERQPLLDEAAGLGLTFDGRIDNRDELKSVLAADRTNGRVETDAELVLAAYRKWGEECPQHLLGDFAFAIWDEPRKRLFCARDHLGVRPFFYAAVGDTFVCASEIRALFAVPSLKMEPNLAIITIRLLGRSVEYDETLYKGVSRLPMAHHLTITREAIRTRRYWDIDPAHEIRYRNDEEYGEHFRELFFDAVGKRLRSAGPIASLLSGGLDSSGIVCTAQRILKERGGTQPRFESFSMVFDHLLSCDERPFIDEVVRHSGVKTNFHLGDRDLGEADLARHVMYPGLLYSPQAMILGSVFKRIRDDGFRILLDGNGGDQLAGNGFHQLLPLLWNFRWLRLLTQLRGSAATYRISPWRLFLIGCVKPSIPGPIKAVYRKLNRSSYAENSGLVREDALVRTGAKDRIAQGVAIPAFKSPVHAEMYETIFSGWSPTVLAESFELLASFYSLELRQPFRDRRLVEFAMALPSEQLWGGGWSRVAYRNGMQGVLPEKILQRRGKAEFSPQYSAVLAGSQATEVRNIFNDSVLVRLGLADGNALRALVEKYQKAPATNTSLQISDWVALEIAGREILGEQIHIPAGEGELSAKNALQSGN